jgi:hypothetical protein
MKKIILFTAVILIGLSPIISGQTVTATVIQQPCNDDGIVAVNMTGMTPPYTLNWGVGDFNYRNILTSNDTLKNISALCIYGWEGYYLNIQVIDNAGSTAYTEVWITPPFTFTTSALPAICPSTIGTASVDITPSSGTYSVDWGSGFQIPFTVTGTGNPASLPVGQYDAMVTDLVSGCAVRSFSIHTDVYSISGISYTPAIIPANCNNGAIILSAPIGGLAPYSYLWENGSTGSSIGGLTSGNYSVIVTDAQGCVQPYYYMNVPQGTILAIHPTISNATCLQHDGSITAFAANGTAPYTYAWSNGATGQTANSLAEGQYAVIVNDANGCLGVNTINVGFNTPITVTYTASASLCTVASGSATILPVGGTAPYTVTWSTYPITNGLSILNMPVGTYYFNVVDAVGCERSGTVYIPPVSSISASISAVNPVCPATNGNVYANVSGTNPPFTYLWNTGATTHHILNTNIDSYSCVIKDAMQCSVTKYGSVYQTSPIHVSMSSTPASCLYTGDGIAHANASGGTAPYSYSWSNGQSGATATSLVVDNYYVGVSDVNGCGGSGYANVSYNTANTACYCTIYGTIFNDANANCIQDVGELGIANQIVHCPPYGYVYTNSTGGYSFQVQTGTYTLTDVITGNYLFSGCQSSSTVVSVVANTGCMQEVNFANSIIQVHDIQIITTSANTPPVVGNPYTQKIIIQNSGTVTESNIQIGYKHDGQLMYINNTPTYLAQQNSASYPNWFSQSGLPSLAPNTSAVVDVNYNIPTNIPIGTTINFYDTTSYSSPINTNWITDHTPWNNVNTFQTTVIAAFDPNYKEVSPKGFFAQGLIATEDSILNYVVHFQNEGSYFAQNIIVVDTLDADLDWTSLKPGYSDHNFTASISESGVLKYTFKNINLAWKSQYGDPLSSGLFSYSIKTKRNLAIGTQFINGAAIYFDYNAPVITNKTLNTLGIVVTGIENKTGLLSDELNVFPNPTNGSVTINSRDNMKSIEVYSITGALLLSESAKDKTHQLQLNNLAEGIYFVKVTYVNSMSVTKKVIKE